MPLRTALQTFGEKDPAEKKAWAMDKGVTSPSPGKTVWAASHASLFFAANTITLQREIVQKGQQHNHCGDTMQLRFMTVKQAASTNVAGMLRTDYSIGKTCHTLESVKMTSYDYSMITVCSSTE